MAENPDLYLVACKYVQKMRFLRSTNEVVLSMNEIGISKGMRGQWSNDLRQQLMSAPSPPPLLKPVQRYYPCSRKPVSRSGASQDAAHPYCDSPNASHGAWRLMQATPAWAVKNRRAPSRHCRDARVCGHMATAMHDIEIVGMRGSVVI